jgi:hypothetical protein
MIGMTPFAARPFPSVMAQEYQEMCHGTGLELSPTQTATYSFRTIEKVSKRCERV